MNYNNNQNNQENDLYSSYTDNENKNINNIEQKPYIMITDKEESKRSILNKAILGSFYIVVLVVAYVVYQIYVDNKYEFYIQKPEVLMTNNSNFQIELKPKDERIFDYKNYKYESTNKDVATVDETGKVTATGEGEAEIKIKYKNGFHEKVVKVKTEELGDSEIESTYEEGRINTVVKGREDLNINADYVSTTPDIEVDEYGHVEIAEETDETVGTVIIRNPNGETEEIEIPVEEEEIEVERLEVVENEITLKNGTKGKIDVRVIPENASNQELVFESDNENVEVDNDGNIIVKNNEQEGIQRTGNKLKVIETNKLKNAITGMDNNIKLVEKNAKGRGVLVGKSVIRIKSFNGKIIAFCIVKITDESKKIEKIDINPKEVEIKVGETKKIIADITPKDATEREIVWESSNTKVATVVSGKVTGISTGEAEVIARTKDGRVRENCKVKVTAKTIDVKKLKITENKINLKVGNKYNLQVEIVPQNATNKKLTYKSNNDNVRVDGAGLITAKKVGKSIVTITSKNGKSIKCEVEVTTNEVAVKSIKLNTNNIEIKKGESYYANATISPENATERNITWTSSKTSVAIVNNNGRIVGKGKGEATITAKTPNGKSASIKVKVTVPVSSITISGESKIRVGARTTYKEEIKPTDASNKKIKWTSSNTKIAAIDNKGNITGKGVGIATITATVNGKTASKTIQVEAKDIPVTGIEITPKEVTLELGHTTTSSLNVSYTPNNATGQSIKEWKSDNPGVATVNNGVVTAVKAGEATITAKSSNGKIATCKVTVKPNSNVPTKVTLNYSGTQELNEGGTLTLKTKLEPTTAKDTLTWTSSNTKIATVNNKGKVTAKKAGTATITVKTSNNLNAKVTIKVNKKENKTVEITSISVNKTSVSLEVDNTYKLSVTILPSNATDKNVTWTSSNDRVATVNNGVVTAVKAGTATITAKSSNGKTAKCVINVAKNEFKYFYYDDSIKVEINDKYYYKNSYFYITKIYLKDPSKQIKKIEAGSETNGKYIPNLKTTTDMLNNTTGAIVGINGSGFYLKNLWVPDKKYDPELVSMGENSWNMMPQGSIIISNSKIRRQINGKHVNHVKPAIGFTKNGEMKYYECTNYSDLTKDNIVNTFYFGPLLVKDGEKYDQGKHINTDECPRKERYDSVAARTVVGQIDKNNFIIITTHDVTSGAKEPTLDTIAEIGLKFKVNILYNLDGGGSRTLWFRNSKSGTGKNLTLSNSESIERRVADSLCFVTLK